MVDDYIPPFVFPFLIDGDNCKCTLEMDTPEGEEIYLCGSCPTLYSTQFCKYRSQEQYAKYEDGLSQVVSIRAICEKPLEELDDVK